jgi:hypothetical protein
LSQLQRAALPGQQQKWQKWTAEQDEKFIKGSS